MSTRRHRSIFFVGALAIAACATSGTSSEGTGTVGGGGRVDSGGDGTTPNGGSDDGAAPGTDAGVSDTGIVITDSSATDTGSTVTPGHMECPTTDDAGATTYAYANEYLAAPPTATACTMGGAACRAYVECCFIDLCVNYPAP